MPRKRIPALLLAAAAALLFSAAPCPAEGLIPRPFFVPNQGQWDAPLLFAQKGRDRAQYIYPDRLLFSAPGTGGRLISLSWGSARPAGSFSGAEALPTRVSFFTGNDPSRHRAGLPAYSRVRLASAFPGTDLLFYDNKGFPEYDLMLAPGADPKKALFTIGGVSEARIGKNGDMEWRMADGKSLLLKKPVAWQEKDGRKIELACAFALLENSPGRIRFGFRTGPRDPGLPTIIDPILDWSTYLGGANEDTAAAVAVDSGGHVIVAGSTASDQGSFPVTQGSFSDTYAGGTHDIFVAKYNSAGDNLVFATYVGGNGNDLASSLAVGPSNEILVCGSTDSTNFPVRSAYAQGQILNGGTDAVVFKLAFNGTGLPFSAYLGGAGDDQAYSIAISGASYAYVVGSTTSATGFPVLNAFQPVFGGGAADAFVARITHSVVPALLASCTFLGGGGTDVAHGVTCDASFVYVGGRTSSGHGGTGFPIVAPLAGSVCRNAGDANSDCFLAKYRTDLQNVNFSTCFGGSTGTGNVAQRVNAVSVDASQRVVCAGTTTADNFPVTAGAFQTAYQGNGDAFLARIDTISRRMAWASYLGGAGLDDARAVCMDTDGRIHAAGLTRSGNFPASTGDYKSLSGAQDAFVTKVAADGASLTYSTYLGGTGEDQANGIAINYLPSAQIVAAGMTASTDFPTKDPIQDANAGAQDAFVVQFDPSPGPNPPTPKPDPDDRSGASCFMDSVKR